MEQETMEQRPAKPEFQQWIRALRERAQETDVPNGDRTWVPLGQPLE